MKKILLLTCLAILTTHIDKIEATPKREKPMTCTYWAGKTAENYPVILEKGTLFVIIEGAKKRVFVLAPGPKGGVGRWQHFIDEDEKIHFVLEGIIVNVTKVPLKEIPQKYCKKRYQNTQSPFDEPNEGYEGGFKGNALLPSMDDRFPYVAF